MENNDIMRRLRYTFDFNDTKMIDLFACADKQVTRAEISNWLKKDDDPDFCFLDDRTMAIFLNGIINDKRGRKEGPQPEPEERLNNNIILRKLKIAFNLKDDDIIDLLLLADLRVSKHEISAFFRKPDHSKFRICKDQIMRNFLQGLQIKYHDEKK